MSFAGSRLWISARSPFARRVRAAFREGGVEFVEEVVDVFKLPPGFAERNPLRRVPAWESADGRERVVDSNLILARFHATEAGRALAWRTAAEAEVSGLALGLCDRTVERFLELQRPATTRDLEVVAEFDEIARDTLARLEAIVPAEGWMSGGARPGQADLDLGVTLAYLSLRYDAPWAEGHPRLRAHLKRCEERPSFVKTAPPGPA